MTYQNDIAELPTLSPYRYENIFPVYSVDGFWCYNILNKIQVPADLDETFFKYYNIPQKMPWTSISYALYSSIELWWLIRIFNTDTHIFFCEANTILKTLKPEYVDQVIAAIKSQL